VFITIAAFIVTVSIGLIFSIYDSTEVVIQKMIEATQRIITVGSSYEGIKGCTGERDESCYQETLRVTN
jgi:hypothetical protein